MKTQQTSLVENVGHNFLMWYVVFKQKNTEKRLFKVFVVCVR